MWHKEISVDELRRSPAWKIGRYREEDAVTELFSEASCKLGDLVRVREESADPSLPPFDELTYLGLDAVESGSGEIRFCKSAGEQNIRSRSKVFRAGDLLYGRLRAYLNKVALVADSMPTGSCSGEFYVLVPDTTRVHPLFLWWILSSEAMVAYVTLRLAGATHPRLSLEDLLDYRIKLPTLEVQELVATMVSRARARRRDLTNELQMLSSQLSEEVQLLLTNG